MKWILLVFLGLAASAALADQSIYAGALADLSAAAAAGNESARECLITTSISGEAPGVDIDQEIAKERIRARKGSLEARYLVAGYEWRRRSGRPEDPEIHRELESLAAAGFSAADVTLGQFSLYTSSPNKPSDYATARKWFERGAVRGNVSAQLYLATFYVRGWGVPQDAAKAAHYIDAAARSTTDCYSDAVHVAQSIAQARVTYPASVRDGTVWGNAVVSYAVKAGHAVDPEIETSSGNPEADAAALAAVTNMPVSHWKYLADHPDVRMSITVGMNLFAADPAAYSQLINGLGYSALVAQWADWIKQPYHPKKTGVAFLTFHYKDGTISDAAVTQSTGDRLGDEKILDAFREAKPVMPPAAYAGRDLLLHIAQADLWNVRHDWAPEDSPQTKLAYGVRAAIDKAVVIPKHAYIVGTTGTGIVALALVYKDGKVHDVKITQGSGDAEVDAAAVHAAATAIYPKPPAALVHRTIPMTDHLVFQVGFAATPGSESAAAASTVETPQAVATPTATTRVTTPAAVTPPPVATENTPYSYIVTGQISSGGWKPCTTPDMSAHSCIVDQFAISQILVTQMMGYRSVARPWQASTGYSIEVNDDVVTASCADELHDKPRVSAQGKVGEKLKIKDLCEVTVQAGPPPQ